MSVLEVNARRAWARRAAAVRHRDGHDAKMGGWDCHCAPRWSAGVRSDSPVSVRTRCNSVGVGGRGCARDVCGCRTPGSGRAGPARRTAAAPSDLRRCPVDVVLKNEPARSWRGLGHLSPPQPRKTAPNVGRARSPVRKHTAARRSRVRKHGRDTAAGARREQNAPSREQNATPAARQSA